jgi:hypothetical protein
MAYFSGALIAPDCRSCSVVSNRKLQKWRAMAAIEQHTNSNEWNERDFFASLIPL